MDYNYLGYRFSPTEEEMISYYLEGKMAGVVFPFHAINTLNICDFEPWQLPEKSALPGDDEGWWYFFGEINKKYANSNRDARTTKHGQWKVTGADRQILDQRGQVIGVKKILVYHNKGHASSKASSTKTNWIIHEYHHANASLYQKPYVLCRLKENSS